MGEEVFELLAQEVATRLQKSKKMVNRLPQDKFQVVKNELIQHFNNKGDYELSAKIKTMREVK